MSSEPRHTLKNTLHPYLFILKEGVEIKNNFLDYSLMMLLVNSSETIKSPKNQINPITNVISQMDISINAIPTILG